jgi:metallo-beta-lactamase class B
MRKLIGSVVFICLLVLSNATLAQGDELHDPEVQRVEPFQVFDNLYYIGVDWVASWLLVTDQGLIVFDALYEELTDLVIGNIGSLDSIPTIFAT